MEVELLFSTKGQKIEINQINTSYARAFRCNESRVSNATYKWTGGVIIFVKLALGYYRNPRFRVEDTVLYKAMVNKRAWYKNLFGSYPICRKEHCYVRPADINVYPYLNNTIVPKSEIPQLWQRLFGEPYPYEIESPTGILHDLSTKVQHNRILLGSAVNIEAELAAKSDASLLQSMEYGAIFNGNVIADLSITICRFGLQRSLEALAPLGINGVINRNERVYFSKNGCGYVGRIYHNRAILTVIIKAQTKTSALELSSELQAPLLRHSKIYFSLPTDFQSIAGPMALYLSSYLNAASHYTKDWISSSIRSLNSYQVAEIYRCVRSYLEKTTGSASIQNEFSLFYHHNGRARYIIDPIRQTVVEKRLIESSTVTVDEKSLFAPSLDALAWYGTSTMNSKLTMSYTDALVPWKTWDGAPSTWKEPIPGFGASEIATYGYGTSHAEPVPIGSYSDSHALCAVYTGSSREVLRGAFLGMDAKIQQNLSIAIKNLENTRTGNVEDA